jgi:homogentisate phytyltransferase/homogentisate geranylgeranyltransferase
LLPTAVGLLRLPGLDGLLLILIHLSLLLLFWFCSLRTNPAQPASMTRFYLLLWGLFYGEYIFLSVYRLVGIVPF